MLQSSESSLKGLLCVKARFEEMSQEVKTLSFKKLVRS